MTDSLTHKAAQASFGFHPRATLGLDTALMFGFRDHWDQADTPYMRELPSPPLGFFQELRFNNVRQKFNDNGLLFGNIHPYTGPAMVDTFIVSFNGDANFLGDSLYLYTHPQILAWPSVLASYADSIILRDISNSQQTAAGPHVHVDMTHDSTFTYFGDNYFDPGTSTFRMLGTSQIPFSNIAAFCCMKSWWAPVWRTVVISSVEGHKCLRSARSATH